MPARLSAIVISRNEGEWLRRTVENMEATLPARSEILVVDDASIDGSADFLAGKRGRVRLCRTPGVGVAQARNIGAQRVSGDVLLFADAHLALPAMWCEPLLELLEDPAIGAVAPGIRGMVPRHKPGYGLRFTGPAMEVRWNGRKTRHPFAAAILPGCALAMRRAIFAKTGHQWDDGLLQRGNVDNEFSVRLWRLGYELMVAPDVMVRHHFRRGSPFPVGWPQYLHNRLRLAFLNFNDERLARTVAALRGYPGYGEALRLVTESNIAERRKLLARRWVRDDDWYFSRFRLNW